MLLLNIMSSNARDLTSSPFSADPVAVQTFLTQLFLFEIILYKQFFFVLSRSFVQLPYIPLCRTCYSSRFHHRIIMYSLKYLCFFSVYSTEKSISVLYFFPKLLVSLFFSTLHFFYLITNKASLNNFYLTEKNPFFCNNHWHRIFFFNNSFSPSSFFYIFSPPCIGFIPT